MSYVFELSPDLAVLINLGFEVSHTIAGSEPSDRTFSFTSHYLTKREAERLLRGYTKLVDKYGLQTNFDTLLYISLLEFEHALTRLNAIAEIENKRNGTVKRKSIKKDTRQLADLLLLFMDAPTGTKINMTFSNSKRTISITSNELSLFLSNIIKQGLLNPSFPMDERGIDALRLIGDPSLPINFKEVDFNRDRLKKIKKMSGDSINPDVTRILVGTLLNIWSYINQFTSLTVPTRKKFSNEQLQLLYELATIFGWIRGSRTKTQMANYLSSLFSDYLKKYTIVEVPENRALIT